MRNDMGDGWLWVTSKSTGLSGIVNRELVKDLVSFLCSVPLSVLQLTQIELKVFTSQLEHIQDDRPESKV